METRIDIRAALDTIGPSWAFGGSVTDGTEGCWNEVSWADERDKPTWQDLLGVAETADAVTKRAVRRAEIAAQLEAVDGASVRPLRAKMAGQGTPADDARLAELEKQAKALRAELAGLG